MVKLSDSVSQREAHFYAVPMRPPLYPDLWRAELVDRQYLMRRGRSQYSGV